MDTANSNDSHVILGHDAKLLAIAGKQEEGSGMCSTGRRLGSVGMVDLDSRRRQI